MLAAFLSPCCARATSSRSCADGSIPSLCLLNTILYKAPGNSYQCYLGTAQMVSLPGVALGQLLGVSYRTPCTPKSEAQKVRSGFTSRRAITSHGCRVAVICGLLLVNQRHWPGASLSTRPTAAWIG